MQRINWFTNPNLTGPLTGINKWGDVTASVNKTNHQLVVSGSNGGYGFNVDVPANTPLVVSMFVYTDITKQSTPVAIMDVDDAGKVTILAGVKPKSNASTMVTRVTSKTGKIRFEAYPVSGTTVNFGDLLVERADTYDKAVGGGASGLLLGGHDATRLRRFVGRVMSDDGHEPDKQSKTQRHAATGRVHADFDHRKAGWRRILVHGLAGRVGRLHHDRRLFGHLQQEPPHRMGLHGHEPESDEPELQGRVRQSDRQGVEHGPVQAGRIPGEQGLDRRPLLFRRGYDAARLTLLGVMA